MFQDDRGLLDNVREEVCNYWIKRGSRLYRHSNNDFSESCTTGGNHNRYFSHKRRTRGGLVAPKAPGPERIHFCI